MMDTSVQEYQAQLEAVEQALAAATNDDEKVSLQGLKTDLLELLELTKQTAELAQLNAKQDESQNDDLADEMKQFMQEIKQLDAEQEPSPDVEKELNELKSQLETMVGQKCSAPHEHSWGARAYHNAIVCGIDDELHVSNDGAPDVCLRVLFTNPTHREMLPCSFFLEGECKFDAANCHYSHGELVPFSALRDYTEPDFGKLARNCVVLAKLEDRLWHKARVLCANFVEKECRVRLEGQHKKTKELDIAFESLLPIFHDEDLSSGSSSDETDSEDLEALEADRRAQLVQQSLFSFAPSQPLGEWEKHTRGIGSKLLAKMGYVVGTGLGWHGRGIVTPISAEVLPQGCSLDYCMALREAANNDKSLFCVEKKLQRDAKRQEVLNAKAYAREAQKVDVFSFLNETILNNNQTTKGVASTPGCSSTQQPKETLQTQSAKSLNVQSVRIADDIRKKERELSGLQQSLRRNASGSEVHKRLQTQLTAKTRELDALKQSEHLLAKEQATRKTKDKLCIF